MRRRTRVSAAAVLAALAVGATGCTGGTDSDGQNGDGKQGGGSSATPAKPGTHASLPEACGSVSEDTLRELLLGAGEERAGDTEELFEGTAAVTYDNERRVGCQWKSAASPGSHHLKVDFERVVSYDSSISDDDRASVLYETRARKDEIPAEAPETDDEDTEGSKDPDGSGAADEEPEGGESDEPGTNEPTGNGSSVPTPSAPDNTQSPGDGSGGTSDPSDDASSNPGLAPRPLEGIGDVAYLNDELVTADSGLHRDVTVVFRAGNVIVTVRYDQWSNDKRLVPGSRELQEKAQKLAKQLAEQLNS